MNSNETDILDLAEIVWKEKVLVCLFLALSLLIGGSIIAIRETKYETTVAFEINLVPPFMKNEMIQSDISRAFHNIEMFSLWKAATPNSALELNDVRQTDLIDGYAFAASKRHSLITFDKANIFIRSNDVDLIVGVMN